MPVYFRNEAELRAPLDGPGSPLKDAFTLDRAETLELTPPFFKAFARTGDALALANAYTGFLRAISEPTVAAALKSLANGAAVLEALYQRVHARMLAEPQRYALRYIEAAALLTRR